MDYLFYTANGDYLHFEFQTTKKKDDISRFLYYDASLYFKSKMNINTINDKNNCLMLLYALFDKFGDNVSKKRFKEVVSMTEVGKMIYEEGIEKGIEKTKEMLIKQLIKKFKIVPEEYKKKIMALPQDVIEVIGTEIFDINSIDELKKYF